MRDVHTSHARTGIRLAPWHERDDTVHLVPAADRSLRAGQIEELLEEATGDGIRRIFTSALTPDEATPFAAAGFVERGRLLVLSCGLARSRPERDRRLRRARPRDHTPLLELDHRCFPDPWRFDRVLLSDALDATPVTRFRLAASPTPLGYAIAGVAGPTAYLQRLAVDPDQQRRGVGRTLVDDARHWAGRRGATTMVVNTAVDNDGALVFYRALGFTRRPTELRVMEWHVDD